jgi:hypothetical protein
MLWVLLGILLIAGSTAFFRSRMTPGFSGDGVLTDSGFLSYPRYRIAFDTVFLTARTNRVLSAKGMPSGTMTVGFELVGNATNSTSQARLEQLRQQGAELSVRIDTDKGELVAQADAPLKEWQLAQSSSRDLLWHAKLRDLHFDRASAYRIVIELSKTERGTDPLLVRPIIEGGGNELP